MITNSIRTFELCRTGRWEGPGPSCPLLRLEAAVLRVDTLMVPAQWLHLDMFFPQYPWAPRTFPAAELPPWGGHQTTPALGSTWTRLPFLSSKSPVALAHAEDRMLANSGVISTARPCLHFHSKEQVFSLFNLYVVPLMQGFPMAELCFSLSSSVTCKEL